MVDSAGHLAANNVAELDRSCPDLSITTSARGAATAARNYLVVPVRTRRVALGADHIGQTIVMRAGH